jgi:hypothetical protein
MDLLMAGLLKEALYHSHVLYVLETVPQITNELIVELLQHPPLSQYVPDTLGCDNYIVY